MEIEQIKPKKERIERKTYSIRLSDKEHNRLLSLGGSRWLQKLLVGQIYEPCRQTKANRRKRLDIMKFEV